MIQRFRPPPSEQTGHKFLMLCDDDGEYVKYEDAKAALCGVMAIPGYSAAFTEVRTVLGDEAVDEWIAQENQRRTAEIAAENKPT